MFKFSFKSLKNIECGYARDPNAGNILAERIVRDQICLICQAYKYIRRGEVHLSSELVDSRESEIQP